jgi:hypothetical protein
MHFKFPAEICFPTPSTILGIDPPKIKMRSGLQPGQILESETPGLESCGSARS